MPSAETRSLIIFTPVTWISWDWEKVIDRSDHNEDYLKAVVKRIVGVICHTLDELEILLSAAGAGTEP